MFSGFGQSSILDLSRNGSTKHVRVINLSVFFFLFFVFFFLSVEPDASRISWLIFIFFERYNHIHLHVKTLTYTVE